MALVGALLATSPLCAANPTDATSRREAKEEAIRAIPWRNLSHQQRRAVQGVVRKPSIYRRLPTRVVQCDADLFTFLMQNPEIVADTWRSMGVSKVKIQRIGEHTFRAEDGLGTTGRFSFLDQSWDDKAFNRALIYAEGGFEGKPFPHPIRARCVMLMRSGSVVETNGRTYVTARVDSFLDIEQVGVEIVAKTVHPLVVKAADYNFTETLKFVSNFSQAAERNPSGVERFTEKLDQIDDATRDELNRLCRAAADRHAELEQARANVAQRTSAVSAAAVTHK